VSNANGAWTDGRRRTEEDGGGGGQCIPIKRFKNLLISTINNSYLRYCCLCEAENYVFFEDKKLGISVIKG
jgi:hypothetical protein